MDPVIQERITTKIDPAIQEQITTKIDPIIYTETFCQPESVLIQTNEKKVNEAFDATVLKLAVISSNQSKIKVNEWKESPYIQMIPTSVVIVLLGTALAVYWNLGSNRNENMTILPNGTIVVPDKVFMENVTLSLQLLKDELLLYKNKVQELQTTVTKVIDSLLYVKGDVKALEGQEEIRTNKTISSDTVFILLFGLAVEGLIFILLIKYLLRNRATADTDIVGYSEISQIYTFSSLMQQYSRFPMSIFLRRIDLQELAPSSSKLLEQVKQVPLDSSVCIVSFHEETQKLHMDLAKSAIQTDIPVKQFLMKEPETQLMSIPCSKFILVFVDYSERNIILETPGKDLGDKKVVTVHAAQKMGADVFVVYVRDRGSTNLPDGVLYNTILASFTRNPTLKKLTVKDRGLSVYETFSDYQKSHINKIISLHS